MTSEVYQIYLQGQRWTSQTFAEARGTAFRRKQKLDAAELADSARACERLSDLIADLNGFFWVVARKGETVEAAVDHIRSTPLFYHVGIDSAYISDDLSWIQEQIGASLNQRDIVEYLHLGYVTRNRTLYSEIRQIQPGECLRVCVGEGQPSVETSRFYEYRHVSDRMTGGDAALYEALEESMTATFERLIDYADGRPIVIPLSGGYDSRLIAVQLKEMSYDNVHAFSYGRPGNEESEISRQVADSLEIPWHFVNYSESAWQQWYASEERRTFFQRPGNIVAVPHLQDWPAVWTLRKKGTVPADAVFVPGHSADVLAGERSDWYPDLYREEVGNRAGVVERILKYYYKLMDWTSSPEVYAILRGAVLEGLEVPVHSGADAISAFENWDWKERQAKFIVNSLRVYEHWGYDWWMPLWDRRFCRFWQEVPTRVRWKRRFCIDYVNQKYEALTGSRPGCWKEVKTQARDIIREYHMLRRLKKWWYITRDRLQDGRAHPLAWYGLLPDDVKGELYDGTRNLNAFIALDRMYGLIDEKSRIE